MSNVIRRFKLTKQKCALVFNNAESKIFATHIEIKDYSDYTHCLQQHQRRTKPKEKCGLAVELFAHLNEYQEWHSNLLLDCILDIFCTSPKIIRAAGT